MLRMDTMRVPTLFQRGGSAICLHTVELLLLRWSALAKAPLWIFWKNQSAPIRPVRVGAFRSCVFAWGAAATWFDVDFGFAWAVRPARLCIASSEPRGHEGVDLFFVPRDGAAALEYGDAFGELAFFLRFENLALLHGGLGQDRR